jgi:sulfite exporter TauE/SafE
VIVEQLTIPAALAAGFAGGAHCAAMCGGIASAAGASFRTGRGLPVAAALAFNGARLVGYALLGALLAAVYGALGALLPLQGIAWAGRIVAVVVMAALALRLLTGRDWLGVERLGAWAWQGLRPLFARAAALPSGLRYGAMGLLWGFLPCGLVYSVLLMAAATSSPVVAAASMLAFGLGTLPPLLGLTLGAATLGDWLRRPGMRRVAGLAVLACAAWTLAFAIGHGPSHAQAAPPADVAAATTADCH